MRDRNCWLGPLFALLIVSLVASGPLGPAPGWAKDKTGDVIVIFREGVARAVKEKAVKKAGATLKFNYLTISAAAAHIPDTAAQAILESDPDVVDIVPDLEVEAHVKETGKKKPGGSASSPQVVPAGVERIAASPGMVAFTGSGVGVAVVDTGLDFNHQDLVPLGSVCFTAFASCGDDNGHGTHVGGIIAARDNAIDVVGVAPKATLYAVKVLDALGSGADSTVMAGLDWVATNWDKVSPKIRAVNMSLGRNGSLNDNPGFHQAVQKLHALGISVVVSAGNDPTLDVSDQVPATYPEVMAIASTTAVDGSNSGCSFYSGTIRKDTASWFTSDGEYDSTTGIGVTISAPGEDQENVAARCYATSIGILSTKLGGGTTRMYGTSMSAPHVTGVVALMWEKALGAGGALDPEVARSKIRQSATLQGTAPLDSPTSGYSYDGEREGIVWAPGALQ